MGQQRDKGRKIGSSGNDDAMLPIVIGGLASLIFRLLSAAVQRVFRGTWKDIQVLLSGHILLVLFWMQIFPTE